MKYQIGEKVRIKKNAKDMITDVLFISPEMDVYCGNIYEVKDSISGMYKLEGVTAYDSTINNDGYWWWAEDWLEPADDDYSEIENDEIMNLFE